MSKKPTNYKIPSTVLGVTAFAITLMGAQNSWAAQFFSDESSFVNALNSTLPSSLVNFENVPTGNILSGTEFQNQGLLFSTLDSSQGALSIVGSKFYHNSKFLNIGSEPFTSGFDSNWDSLAVTVLGDYRAFGVQIVDSSFPGNAESVQVFGKSNNLLFTLAPPATPTSYFGFVADEAIGRVVFNEAIGDTDDVGYDNFLLGNGTAPRSVPESTSVFGLLMSLGFFGLLQKRQEKEKAKNSSFS